MNKIIIIGSGGHARACLDIIREEKKYSFYSFIDRKINIKKKIFLEKDLKKIKKKIKYAFIGIGQIKDHKPRLKLFRKLKNLGFKLPTIVSPHAYVSKSSVIGEGSIVMHGAIINANAKIGKNVIINTGAIIEHDVQIGDNSHISTCATINGECRIGKNTFLGSNSVVVNNIKIDKLKFIKANSFIKKNI